MQLNLVMEGANNGGEASSSDDGQTVAALRKRMIEEIETVGHIPQQLVGPLKEELIFKAVKEELVITKERIFARIMRIVNDGNQALARRSMKLQFRNRISQTILTGEEIKGEGNISIEVALVDDSTGNIIEVGPEASATVEIVVLKGVFDASEGDDWTVEEFKDKIVPELEGKNPFLAGNVCLKLQGGIGVLDNIKFRHHTSKKKPSEFRLGARVVDTLDGARIKEAKTESFTVKDFRYKYYKKHETPSMSDEVPRLANIRKGGKIDKRLQDRKIYTVEDFLIQLLVDPEELKRIVNLGAKKWEVTVNNARACQNVKRMYWYINSEQKTGVVFNVLGLVLGLYSKGQYSLTNMLSESHKADAHELFASACKNWEGVVRFEDENSLQQHFTGLRTFDDPKPDYLDSCHNDNLETICDPLLQHNPGFFLFLDNVLTNSDSFHQNDNLDDMFTNTGLCTFVHPNPDYPSGGHDNNETFEMQVESSNRYSNFPFPSIISLLSSTAETDLEDFGSSNIDNLDDMFTNPDYFLHQNDNSDVQLNDPINELNADEHIAATVTMFGESPVVHTSKPPKRWKKAKKLFWVSRWFSVRKTVATKGNHNRKKQKAR